MSRHNPSPSSDPWLDLETTWQAETLPPPAGQAQEIARLGRRQQRIRRLVVFSEVLICLIFSAWSILWLTQGSLPEQIAATFVLTVILFAALARRHAWFQRRWPDDEPPHEKIQRLLDRNAEGFRGLRLGHGLLWMEVIFFLVWLPLKNGSQNAEWPVGSYAFLAFWTLLYLVGLWLSKRHLQRERRLLEEIRVDITAG